jgi:hypothetical protein
MDDQLEADDPRFDDPSMQRAAQVRARSGWLTVWRVLGIVVVVTAIGAGMLYLGFIALVTLLFSNGFGSNK